MQSFLELDRHNYYELNRKKQMFSNNTKVSVQRQNFHFWVNYSVNNYARQISSIGLGSVDKYNTGNGSDYTMDFFFVSKGQIAKDRPRISILLKQSVFADTWILHKDRHICSACTPH